MARAALRTAYGLIEREMEAKTWAIGDAFTMADCAAAPALFYADLVEPLGEHVAKRLIVQRLAVRDDAIEIKNDRPQHESQKSKR